MTSRHRLRRRAVLAGLGGIGIALPLLEIAGFDLSRRADASPLPRRLVVVFRGNGAVPEAWEPSGSGADFTLSPTLEPLAPHRDDLLMLRGLDLESSYHGPGDGSHWNGMGHLLTATELVDLGAGSFIGGGISVDQVVAAHVGQSTRLASLELCVEDHPATVASRMSYLGAARPVPPEPDPRRAFARLFGEAPPELRARRKSVLDAVSGDLDALGPRLGREDRAKIDAHLEAVREIEKRIDVLTACAAGAPPVLRLDPAQPAAFRTVGRLQMDLLVRALACDATRVASLMWSTSSSMTRMTWLGISGTHHDLTHDVDADPTSRQQVAAIDRWYAGELAYLLAAMKSVPEGDGTLLDHTAVLWCTEIADGPTHARRNVPWLLAGSCGGAFTTGRVVDLGGRSHADLLLSLCHALGVELASFGNPAYGGGPIAELG